MKKWTKCKCRGVLLVLLLLCVSTIANAGSWTSIGLGTLNVYSVVIDPSNNQTIYAGGSTFSGTGGGLFKSSNGGSTWSSNMLTGTYVKALAIDPTSSQTIYAGTETYGVMKSINGGSSWTTLNSGSPTTNTFVESIAIDPINTKTIYCACSGISGEPNAGLFKSGDGGSSWAAIGFTGKSLDVISLAIDPRNSQTVYIGRNGSGGVYKSINGGGSWSSANNGIPLVTICYAIAIDPNNSQNIYAATDHGIYISTSAGSSWNIVSNGIPTNTHFVSILVDPTNSKNIYAGSVSSGVFRSTNGGNSWTTINNGLTGDIVESIAMSTNHTIYLGNDGGGVSKGIYPSISGTPATGVTVGNVYNFTPTTTDASSFSVSNMPPWANFNTSTGALTGTPASTNVGTSNNIVISAIDSTGTVSLAAFSITVALPM